MSKIALAMIVWTVLFAQEQAKNKSEVYIPFNIHSTGYYTLGVGYRWGIKQNACMEIEGSYGSISSSAYDPSTGITTSVRCEMYGGGVAVIYGKNMGISLNNQIKLGAGARLSLMYITASVDYYFTDLDVNTLAVVPYILGVLELPVISLEANLAIFQSAISPGFRVCIRF
jgi:hypothetical protein